MIELNLESMLSAQLSVSAGDKIGLSLSNYCFAEEFEVYGSNASLLRGGAIHGEGAVPRALLSRLYSG